MLDIFYLLPGTLEKRVYGNVDCFANGFQGQELDSDAASNKEAIDVVVNARAICLN